MGGRCAHLYLLLPLRLLTSCSPLILIILLIGCSAPGSITAANPAAINPPNTAALSQAENYCDNIFKIRRDPAMMAVFGGSYGSCYRQRASEVSRSAAPVSAPGVEAAQAYCSEIFNLHPNVGMMAVFGNGFENCLAVRASEIASTLRQPTPTSEIPVQSADVDSKRVQVSTAPDEVSLQVRGGLFEVPVLVNEALRLRFLIDSGASNVSIPADVVLTLMRTGTITSSDFLGRETFVLADGSTMPSTIIRIKTLKIGRRTIANVIGNVAPANGDLLLGQSFLRRLSSWSIDNNRQVLVMR